MRRVSFLFITLFLVTPAVSSAQTTLATQIISINHENGTTKTQADILSNTSYWFVNRQDCGLDSYPSDQAEGSATVRVRATSQSGSTVNFGPTPQIWIGANCNLAANRTSSTTVPCTRAVATTNGASIDLLNNVYTLDLDALFPADSAKTSFDVCNTASGGGKLEFWVMSAGEGTSQDVTNYVYFYLNGDTAAPSAVSITTTDPSGDNSIPLEYSSGSTIETYAEVFYFAVADGCSGPSMSDAGTDAGSDAGASDGGTATTASQVAPTYPVAGQLPPEGADGVVTDTAGSDGDTSISSGSLGLTTSGDGATLGVAVMDRAGNYSVLSNVVCVRKIDTYGLCDTGNCRRGDCTVSPGSRVSIVVLCAMVAASVALIRRRGLRS